MNITKRCDLCETALEYEHDGQRLAFTAHDAAFCADLTRARIRRFGRALEQAARDRAETEASLRRRLYQQDVEIGLLRDCIDDVAGDSEWARETALRVVRDRGRWERQVIERMQEQANRENERVVEMQRLARPLAGFIERIRERSEQRESPPSDAMARAWDAAMEDGRQMLARDDETRARGHWTTPAGNGFVARIGSYANIVTDGPAVSIPAPDGGWPDEDEEPTP